ncbi:hypothetical protein VP01_3077g1 [Puccinia sorghi]|uniref:Uncharacterized protein n=1 Tax=Puccinia sorghi TaxID=27349 RepID=A0A0L6UZP3_9BASI|nr:hypothetical protein VP01_3077g1 [Puccinia sorghi]
MVFPVPRGQAFFGWLSPLQSSLGLHNVSGYLDILVLGDYGKTTELFPFFFFLVYAQKILHLFGIFCIHVLICPQTTFMFINVLCVSWGVRRLLTGVSECQKSASQHHLVFSLSSVPPVEGSFFSTEFRDHRQDSIVSGPRLPGHDSELTVIAGTQQVSEILPLSLGITAGIAYGHKLIKKLIGGKRQKTILSLIYEVEQLFWLIFFTKVFNPLLDSRNRNSSFLRSNVKYENLNPGRPKIAVKFIHLPPPMLYPKMKHMIRISSPQNYCSSCSEGDFIFFFNHLDVFPLWRLKKFSLPFLCNPAFLCTNYWQLHTHFSLFQVFISMTCFNYRHILSIILDFYPSPWEPAMALHVQDAIKFLNSNNSISENTRIFLLGNLQDHQPLGLSLTRISKTVWPNFFHQIAITCRFTESSPPMCIEYSLFSLLKTPGSMDRYIYTSICIPLPTTLPPCSSSPLPFPLSSLTPNPRSPLPAAPPLLPPHSSGPLLHKIQSNPLATQPAWFIPAAPSEVTLDNLLRIPKSLKILSFQQLLLRPAAILLPIKAPHRYSHNDEIPFIIFFNFVCLKLERLTSRYISSMLLNSLRETEIGEPPKYEQGILPPHLCSCRFAIEIALNYTGYLYCCFILFRFDLSFGGVRILKLESNTYQYPLLVKTTLIFIINLNKIRNQFVSKKMISLLIPQNKNVNQDSLLSGLWLSSSSDEGLRWGSALVQADINMITHFWECWKLSPGDCNTYGTPQLNPPFLKLKPKGIHTAGLGGLRTICQWGSRSNFFKC